MKIPKSFKVFASTINVGFDNVRLSNDGVLGEHPEKDSELQLLKNILIYITSHELNIE